LKKEIYMLLICLFLIAGCQPADTGGKTLAEIDDTNAEEAAIGGRDNVENIAETDATEVDAVQDADNAKDAEKTEKEADEAVSDSAIHTISWGEFFDDGDHTQPSKKFKELNGEQVSIKGWMGEVLNLGKGWFLLISEPGGECPFCSEDESFWNEIMLVFVEDSAQLRYTKEPLVVEGRLDVGIKVDESNFKTMFRLYDAAFTPM